ncbi:MAG: hypothetical protein JXJ17_14330 [Anaerolineae bacterium]|nr:hypothetical protein [Anaerolineae bacterium]
MAIEVGWHDREKTVLVWTISGAVTVAEYYQASRVSHECHDSVSYDVTTVFDVRRLVELPNDIFKLLSIAAADVPTNQHMAFALGAFGRVRTVVNIFSRVYINIFLVESMDEVYEMIHDYREELLKRQMDRGVT